MKTLQDIAREAGVSVSTVSRVLNSSGYTSKATREKVRKAAAGYIPNTIAQSMVSGQTRTVGIAINCTPEYFFMNDFYSKILLGISSALSERKYRMLFIMNEKEDVLQELYLNRRVDGFLLLGGNQDDGLTNLLEASRVPFVVVGAWKDLKEQIIVEIDNYKYAYEMVQYLIHLGHRQIGMISGPLNNGSFAERVRGYKQALSDSHIELNEEYLQVCQYSISEEAESCAKKLMYMPDKVTAIFGANDVIAVSVYCGAKALGLKIPEDLSVAGFDDSQLSRYVSPPLTTVWQPSREKGYLAAGRLLDILEGEAEGQTPELKCYIQYRESCCPPKSSCAP